MGVYNPLGVPQEQWRYSVEWRVMSAVDRVHCFGSVVGYIPGQSKKVYTFNEP